MKTTPFICVSLAAVTFTTAAVSEEIVTNRLSASLRFGLNISARFKGNAAALPTPQITRTTPDGDTYNYDNGYVGGVNGLRPDSSGNEGGQTWYWGYDNSATHPAGQVSDGVAFPANSILLSGSVPSGNFTAPTMADDPHLGLEVTYNRNLGAMNGASYGVEVAGNYLNLSLRDNRSFSGSTLRTTDAYPYTPGTTPPAASAANPYQGSFSGYGFLLGDQPVASATALVPGGYTISGTRKLDADLWGWRLGPYLDFPVAENVNVWLTGGLAVGVLAADASWTETVSMPGRSTLPSVGRGSDCQALWGWYLGANLSWDVNERWSALAGVQYQDLGKYSHDFGGRTVELDLSQSIFVTLGVSYRF